MAIALLLVSAGCSDGRNCACFVIPPDQDDDDRPLLVRLATLESDYAVGETISVEVLIDEAENVQSVAFHLLFDQDVIQYILPAIEGPFLGSDGARTLLLSTETEDGGEVIVAMSRLGTGVGVDGSGLLLTFNFLAVSPGDCGFVFDGATVKDPSARDLGAHFASASVSVI